MKLKTKNSGVSFAVGMIVSTLLLTIGLSIFTSVSKVAEQGYDLEAKNQLYFQNEAGFEAALYEHNRLGGKGLDFMGTDTSQTIDLGNGNSTTWTVSGRKDNAVTGILKEGETIEIPFYYDSRANPSLGESITQVANDFSLKFSRFEFDSDGGFNASNDEIIPLISTGNFNFPDGDNDSFVAKNNVVINWSASRTNGGQLQTFVPRKNDNTDICPGAITAQNPTSYYVTDSGFFCEAYLNGNNTATVNNASIASTKAIIGHILPGKTETTLNNFWDETGTSNRKISFAPVTKFFNDFNPAEKIKGIPWSLTVSGQSIPTPTFTIETHSSVRNGQFEKSKTTTLKEKTAISGFDGLNLD